MNVTAIEIAEAIEKAITRYLEEASDRNEMRFTRFIDLGGKQLDIYLYPPVSGASVWSIVGIKSVYRDEQGDCMLFNVKLPSSDRRFEYVQVSPVKEDLPQIAKKIVDFLRDDLKAVIEGAMLEGGNLALGGKGSEKDGSDTEMAAKEIEPDSIDRDAPGENDYAEPVEAADPGDSQEPSSEGDSEEPEDDAAEVSGA
jgi:hypothetical protein